MAFLFSDPRTGFLFSYQSRFDYWLSTNSIEHTDPLTADIDSTIRTLLSKTAGFDLFSAPPGTSLPNIIERRTHLKAKNDDLSFRLLSNRFLMLNS